MPRLSERVPTIMGYPIPSWFKDLAQEVEIQGKRLEAVEFKRRAWLKELGDQVADYARRLEALEDGVKALVKRDLIEEALVLLGEAPFWGDSPSFRRILLSIQCLLERAQKEKQDDPG